MRSILKIFATGFGAGYLPKAPGTFGTLVAIPIFCLLYGLPGLIYFALLIGLTFFAVWTANETLGLFAAEAKADDPKQIVIDEVVGFLWTTGICFYSPGLTPKFWFLWIALFVAFRFFDVVKVWPANWVEQNWKRGWGIVMDDVVAGIYAGVAVVVLFFLLERMFG